MTPNGIEFANLPPDVQASIKRREAVTQPIHKAVASLDLTWEIASGNLAELDSALRPWEGENWRNIYGNVQAEHRYHRHVLRLFHNFLGSAVSAVWHADRIVGRLKKDLNEFDPSLRTAFYKRYAVLQASDHYRVLRCLRHYAVHTGHHSTVLVLRDREGPGVLSLSGSVCFDVKVVLRYLDENTRPRAREKREELEEFRRIVRALPEHAEMREILGKYFAEVVDLLQWLRRALVDVSTAANARPLVDWAAPQATRP